MSKYPKHTVANFNDTEEWGSMFMSVKDQIRAVNLKSAWVGYSTRLLSSHTKGVYIYCMGKDFPDIWRWPLQTLTSQIAHLQWAIGGYGWQGQVAHPPCQLQPGTGGLAHPRYAIWVVMSHTKMPENQIEHSFNICITSFLNIKCSFLP